ncbi:hypothetical protein [Streptacidiphilus rugosus]|uniref:hypothetical protein n=1 Tax=Streptacidiphilus rugosus TaxID=405783 RepID=UPI000567E663|nr:hypothetical protein [Streptacidiphilus rugosus]
MSTLDSLAAALRQPAPADVERLAWDTLTLAADLADALAWTDGVSPETAIAASGAAIAGRDLLAIPAEGPSPLLPEPVARSQAGQLADLLDRARLLLDQAGRATADPDQVHRLHACADRAAEAAAGLRHLDAP